MTDARSRDDLPSLVDRILISHTAFNTARTRIDQCFHAMQRGATPYGIAIVGESRTGKSTVLNEVGLAYPPWRDANGRKVPFLQATVPSVPKVKGLASLLLAALGDPKFNKGSEIELTLRLQELLAKAQTLILALDEFQHFQDKATLKVQHEVADWLKVLVDQAKVSLVVTGLPRCLSVIHQNEQLAGRFTAPVVLPRFDWKKEADRNEFAGILKTMRESLGMFDLPELHTDEMAFRFYCASGGLIGYVAKILKQATLDALEKKRWKIDLEALSVAAGEAVVQENPIIAQGFNPFDPKFQSAPTEGLLDIVRTVGMPAEEQLRPRSRGRQTAAPTANEVMSKGA